MHQLKILPFFSIFPSGVVLLYVLVGLDETFPLGVHLHIRELLSSIIHHFSGNFLPNMFFLYISQMFLRIFHTKKSIIKYFHVSIISLRDLESPFSLDVSIWDWGTVEWDPLLWGNTFSLFMYS
jgi:hypothetical protein